MKNKASYVNDMKEYIKEKIILNQNLWASNNPVFLIAKFQHIQKFMRFNNISLQTQLQEWGIRLENCKVNYYEFFNNNRFQNIRFLCFRKCNLDSQSFNTLTSFYYKMKFIILIDLTANKIKIVHYNQLIFLITVQVLILFDNKLQKIPKDEIEKFMNSNPEDLRIKY